MVARAKEYPGFALAMEAEAVDLMRDGVRVVGVRANTASGPASIRADLVIAADGRQSTLRRAAGLEVEDFAAPMDVLWFKLGRHAKTSTPCSAASRPDKP